MIPSRATVNISSRPSSTDPTASGFSFFHLGGETTRIAQTGLRVGVGEDPGEPFVDRFLAGDRQVAGDIAALVQGAMLHQRLGPEHFGNSGPQRLGTVDRRLQPRQSASRNSATAAVAAVTKQL
jgi:hypothetical protein